MSGTVRYYSNDASVPAVLVTLSGPGQVSTETDITGGYAFNDPGPGNWRLQPSKTGGRNDAISALDATHVLQSVVGMRELNAHQALACDVTGDGTVSALDASRILQYIAGMRSRFTVAESCDSDWVFVPSVATLPNQIVEPPLTAPTCAPGAIAFEPLLPPVAAQDFQAIVFGDCTGNWQPAEPSPTTTASPVNTPTTTHTDLPESTPTSSPTHTPLPTSTASATNTAAPLPTTTGTATRTATNSATATSTATNAPLATNTAVPTATRSQTPTRTPLATSTGTRTATITATVTVTPPATFTRTPLPSSTSTRTTTGTRTNTISPTITATWTGTVTRTGTRTQTPTPTPTASLTPTVPCPNGLAWSVSPPTLISAQSGGNLWLAKTVPTTFGWGIFWLRQDPGASNQARLYYAHVDFAGQITVAPLLVMDIPKINFRGHYFFAAWNQDHYGLTIASNATLYYYNLSLEGVESGRKTVPVPLFVSTIYDQESDGDLDAYPGGFLGVVEGNCAGHSCSYAYKLDLDGDSVTSPINLVDFDLTHQFYPRAAFDGAGFAILSVKDIQIAGGGVMTKYLPLSGAISSHAKVVPAKEYLWDEFPDIAWNGNHFAAVWTENSARSHQAPWQIHFASFHRTKTVASLIGERVIDMVTQKTNHRWTTQVHAAGADWIAQYATRAADSSVVAVYELLGDNGQTRAALEPFTLTADALGSSPHVAAGHVGTLGIARGSNLQSGSEVHFYTLPAPACAP